jgi:hypothetical protein
LLFLPLFVSGQYAFEKYPTVKYISFNNWKTIETEKIVENSISIPNFFERGKSLTIQLNSSKKHWFENSDVKVGTQKFIENVGFNPIALDSIRIADFNGDGLKDIKIIAPYMGNGTASMNVRVIYLFQQENESFLKISFNDKQSENRSERDFDGDGNYEIITMKLMWFENHSYWNFNVFKLVNENLISVNKKYDYPILVQFLEKENYKITNKISRQKMKSFALSLPEGYSMEK